MKLAVVGAAGRMGRTLCRIVLETQGCELIGGTELPGSPYLGQDLGLLSGGSQTGVTVSDDPVPVFAQADGVLDFTVPAATLEFAALAAQARIVHIIGTTGFGDEDESKLEAAARHAVIVKAGNMSLGVNLLVALTERVAAVLDESFDIEILDMHHRHKVDAPSGTALMLGEAAAKGRGVDLKDRSVRARDGHTGARGGGDIGFAVLRGGSVVGEHDVFFAGEGETVTLSHRASDRAIFARGAVKAALWGRGKSPGMYGMRDVLGL